MPLYTFMCDPENRGCSHVFSISCLMNEISTKKPKCPGCKKTKSVIRDWSNDNIYVGDSSPKTVGALADRNARNMSSDEQHSIKTKNRIQKPKFTGSVPEGGSLLPVDSKGKKYIPKKKMSKQKANELKKKFRKNQDA